MLPGKIATLLVVAAILSVIGALLVAWRYRVAMQALMKAPITAPASVQTAPDRPLPYAADTPASPVSLAENRQAEGQLILTFVSITVLIDRKSTRLNSSH